MTKVTKYSSKAMKLSWMWQGIHDLIDKTSLDFTSKYMWLVCRDIGGKFNLLILFIWCIAAKYTVFQRESNNFQDILMMP